MNYQLLLSNWGMGIGDWGILGRWGNNFPDAQSPITNHQSPIINYELITNYVC